MAGQPILPPNLVDKLPGDLRSLHDSVLHLECGILQMKNPTYPVFMGRVPKGLGFVDTSPGDVFFLRFDDIFNMFHMKRLYPTFVRLVALSMAQQLIKEETPGIAIMDPYYMVEWILSSPGDRVIVTRYIEEFFVTNKDKDVILVPYFPE